ncbi:MAG: PAS domain S-box protein [Cyanobacteria bacterium SZAS TMP-1]|nr:PAS domain S-box protein [Cyanobacteria bacterium SZAS TMP-1]
MPLSLSKKAIILVTVPVLFEIGLVGTLASAFIRAEEARKQENRSRELTSHLNTVMSMHLQRVAFLVLSSKAPGPGVDARVNELKEKMKVEFVQISQLALHDPAQKEKWKTLMMLAKNLDDTYNMAKVYYSNDNKAAAAFEFARVQSYLDQLIQITDQLNESQAQLLNERHAELLKSGREIEIALWAAVIGSLVIAFGLLIYFNRGTSDRLQALMKNTELLAVGKAPNKALSGDDELAEIDRLFHQLHNSLTNLRQRERTILDNAAEIICSIDEDLRFGDVNNAVEKIWGYTPGDLLGKRAIDLIDKQDQKTALQVLRDASKSKNGDQVRFEVRVTRADGTVSDTEWSATFSADTHTLCCVIHDISERKEIDRLKQEFVAMVSHDLRAPLTAIQMVHSMIEADMEMMPDASPDTQRNLTIARDNINRLMALINNLLDLDKLESGMMDLLPEQQPILPVVQKAVDAVSAIAQKNKLTVGIYVDPVLEGYFDEEKLIQVVVNLLSNAYKFSPPSSQVRVVAVLTEGAEKGFVRLAIIDQGRGVPEAMQAKIFERFKQAETADGRKQKGSGLGLSICKAIIEQHHGHIGVKSQDGRGSTFWFTVPLNKDVFQAANKV